MNETAAYEIIGQEAEMACFRIYHGDHPDRIKELAKEKVIKSNLRFVLKFAIDYHRISGRPIADFVAAGKLGLMEAFYKFNMNAGVKFGSYAIWYIRTRVNQLINEEHDLIRVPVRLRKKVLKAIRNGQPVDNIKYGAKAACAIFGKQSMDTPLCNDHGDSDTTIGDLLTYDDERNAVDEYASGVISDRIASAIATELDSDEQAVIKSFFGIGEEETSLDVVSEEMGTSKDWARRVKARALAKLRDARGLGKLNGMV